jgi:hypothetical protein
VSGFSCAFFGSPGTGSADPIEGCAGFYDESARLDPTGHLRGPSDLDGPALSDVSAQSAGDHQTTGADIGFDLRSPAYDEEVIGVYLALESSIDARITGKVDPPGDGNARLDAVPELACFVGGKGCEGEVGHEQAALSSGRFP